jgi:hypothetical protein
MLSSDRLRTTHGDDHDETDLWDRLRSEANRRSSLLPGAPSQPPPARLDDYRAAFESDLPDELLGDSDLPPSPYESAQRFVQSSIPPRQSYARTQREYSEAAQLAQYEAQHAQYGDEQYDGEVQDEYRQDDYEAQQYAQEQYNLQQFAQTEQQFAQQHAQQSLHATMAPGGSFGQSYAPQQVAAYGHVQPEPAPQQWGYQQQAPVVAPALASGEVDETGKSSRWTKPFVALAALLALAAAGYQFVLVPRRQAERMAQLAELQQRQALLIAQQEKEQAEAAARAEAEQKAENEAALKRADEAAAAAAAAAQAVAQASTAKGGSSKAKAADSSGDDEERDRKRAERHERRAARAAAKAEQSESRSAKSEVASAKPSKKKVDTSAEESSDDPLLGL